MRRAELRAIAGAAALAALAAATPARACTVSVTSVAFGTYDTISPADDDSAGTLSLVCHPSVNSPKVEIGGGSSGSPLARTLRNGAVTLDYNLYSDAARTIVWGDDSTGSSVTLSGGASAGGQRRFNRPIYGRIPALQPVGAGLYSDMLIVTVTF